MGMRLLRRASLQGFCSIYNKERLQFRVVPLNVCSHHERSEVVFLN